MRRTATRLLDQVESPDHHPDTDERHVGHDRVAPGDQQRAEQFDGVDERREGWLIVWKVRG